MLIKFDKKLYKLQAVKSAVKDYQDLAAFKVSSNKGYIQVEFKATGKENNQLIKDEFCNYVFSLMKT